MENFPVEILTHIFKFLPSLSDRKAASLVCHQWYEAFLNPVFRNQEVVEITNEDQFQYFINSSNFRFFHIVIREIDINDQSLIFWYHVGPQLKTLTIFNCDIQERTFVYIAIQCQKLESLTIQNCRELLMSGRLLENEQDRCHVTESLKSLKYLNLSYNRYLSDSLLVKFLSTCQNISALVLSGCQISTHYGLYKKYYPEGYSLPSESVLTFVTILEYIKSHSEQFKALSFNDTFIESVPVSYLAQITGLKLTSLNLQNCQQLSNVGIVKLSEHQTCLTELDISLCPRVTDHSLIAISSGLTNLRVLSVQRCRAITDIGVASLSKLEHLCRLNISECELIQGSGIIEGLCQNVNYNLKEFRLSHLGNLTEQFVMRLSECTPNLTLLDLGCCYNAVTDKTIQSILSNNRLLRHLVIAMCGKVSDSGLTGVGSGYVPESKTLLKFPLGSKAELEIVRDAKLKQGVSDLCESESSKMEGSGVALNNLLGLEVLIASGCNRITDVSLKHAFYLRELKTLDLSHCQQISGEGLKHVSENNTSIEWLDLDNCHNVDDFGIECVGKNLKRLKTLVIGSKKVTDISAQYVAMYGGQLSYLDIRHCEQITMQGVEKIQNGLPKLKNFLYVLSGQTGDGLVPPAPSIGLWVNK